MFWNKKKQKRMTVSDMNRYTWSSGNFGSTLASLDEDELKESVYFRCIQRLSSDVGKVPIELKQHTDNGEVLVNMSPLFEIVNKRPNPFMSNVDFWKTMEALRQHTGASWALINRDLKDNVTGLYPINVTEILIDNAGFAKTKMQNPILIQYTCGANGQLYYCTYEDVIHLKGFSLNGFDTIAVREYLQDTITTNKTAQNYQKNLFANGLTNKAVVQLTSDIQDKSELRKIQKKFNDLYSEEGRIFTVPVGFQLTPLNLNLADSQFAELKKLSAIDICTSFGVQPYMIGLLDNYNNSSTEQAGLDYLVNTLQILFESIEAELDYKLLTQAQRQQGFYFKFNTEVLLRIDKKTQADILTEYVKNSILSPNEVRLQIGRDKAPDGDELLASSGVMKLKDIYGLAKKNAEEVRDDGGEGQASEASEEPTNED